MQVLSGLSVPWWIAGGWAIDLFVGHETRAHGDIEIAVLRRDQLAIQKQLKGWDLQIADVGSLEPWPTGQAIVPAKHAVWARRGGDAWEIEIALEESEGTRWIYRRHTRIGLNIADLGMRSDSGIPYIRPEVALLYKSKATRPVDETDFLYVLPRLDPARKAWLVAALWREGSRKISQGCAKAKDCPEPSTHRGCARLSSWSVGGQD